MSITDKLFAGSIPATYDRYLVPLIFAAYAADMATRIAKLSPMTVLETAAGTGVVARALLPRLAPDACYVATDLNQPMLDHAAKQIEDARLGWQKADALSLPFPDASFDVVCCQFGAMFFPDRVAAYKEARRVLKPNGAYLFSVWDRIEDNVFARDVTDALADVFPGDPPRFLARTPHGYHDTAAIRAELLRAGFGRVSIETKPDVSRAPNAQWPAIAFCQGTPLASEIESRQSGAMAAATARAAAYIAKRHGPDAVAAKMQAHIVTAAA